MMSQVKEIPGFSNKRGGGYTGEFLAEDVKKMLAEPTQKKESQSPTTAAPRAAPKAKTTIRHNPAQTQRVGYRKITITIPEEIALTILNYAGHSSKKSATLDVWYAQNKEPKVDNPLPTYPLANLYQVAKPKVEALAKSK